MRLLYATTVLTLAVALVGCANRDNKDKVPAKGGPATVEYEVYPTEVIILKPGETKDVQVKRKGKDLKDVDLVVTPADATDKTVTIEGGKFKGAEQEAKVTIRTTPETPEKEYVINVKAGDQVKTIKIRVEKGGNAVVTPPDKKAPEMKDEKKEAAKPALDKKPVEKE